MVLRPLAVLVLLLGSAGAQELFRNPMFEDSFGNQKENWWCNGCTLSTSQDAYEGLQSAKVTARRANWAGIWQNVAVEAGKSYHFNMQVKLLNQLQDKLWHELTAVIKLTFTDGSFKYTHISRSPYMRKDLGWVQIGGDFAVPDKEVASGGFYLQLPDIEVTYLVDAASMKEIVANPDWKQEANQRIQQIRKRDIRIRLRTNQYEPQDLEIEVKQVRHDFAFGSAVKARLLAGDSPQDQAYQQKFYEMFEWAVIENALKWRQMEWTQGVYKTEDAVKAVDALRENGIPIRGHNVLWGVEDKCPNWLPLLSDAQVVEETQKRINHVVTLFKGKLAHWDVNNEQLHGSFYEERSGDPWYTESVFRDIHALDPDVKLFFNEFAVVNQGSFTYAYVQQLKHAVANNVPVYGLGVQSHQRQDFDIHAVKERLDVLATAGVPLWITELTVPHDDVNKRAEGYEDLLRLYFSHPAVEGVLLWGFWDGAIYDTKVALVEGENLTLNAAGERYMMLVKEEFTSKRTFVPRRRRQTLSMRGFHGKYEITVKHKGEVLLTRKIAIPKKPTTFYYTLSL